MKKNNKREREIRDELNELYRSGSRSVRNYVKDILKKTPANEMSYDECCSLKEEILRMNKREIDAIDTEMEKIADEMKRLEKQKSNLQKARLVRFENLDDTKIHYRVYCASGCDYYTTIFLNTSEGKEVILYDGDICRAEPDILDLYNCPDKYKSDFIMLWKKAKEEADNLSREAHEKYNREEAERAWKKMRFLFGTESQMNAKDIPLDIRKKFFRTLAKVYHSDSCGNVVQIKNDDPDVGRYVVRMKELLQI